MRVTCDTNILVRAAIRPLGPARAALEATTQPPHRLVLSEFILDEVHRALHCDRIQRQFAIGNEEIDRLANALRAVADVVTIPEGCTLVATDPDDDPVIATAVAGQADVLCTLDQHLRKPLIHAYLATYNVRILTDVELLLELRQADSGNP